MPFLELKNIDAFYGDVQVVFDLSLKVEEGEVVSIIGSNGAGKSTLLKTISGLMTSARGEILFEGFPIHDQPPEKIVERGIVQVPEGRRLFTLMTVKDNLIVGAYNSRADRQREKTLQEVLGLLPRLRERESQLAMTLSGGEQQMVAIGRGLMARPKLLMLDEPSLGLAPLIVKQIFEVIEELNKTEGLTVFLVEQNAYHALKLAHRGYVMVNGEITLSGSGADLLADDRVRQAYLGM
jgi:branched-chain amino acid transport system ATP-binding protein